MRNSNLNERRNQAEFYEQTLNDIRILQRRTKQLKLSQEVSLIEIKVCDQEITKHKRELEELYYDLVKVLDDYSNENKSKEDHFRNLELED